MLHKSFDRLCGAVVDLYVIFRIKFGLRAKHVERCTHVATYRRLTLMAKKND